MIVAYAILAVLLLPALLVLAIGLGPVLVVILCAVGFGLIVFVLGNLVIGLVVSLRELGKAGVRHLHHTA